MGGAGGLGAAPKGGRLGPVPKIPLGDDRTLGRSATLDQKHGLTAQPAPFGAMPALPIAPGAPGDVRLESFFRRFSESTERAHLFAQKRAIDLSEQLLQSLSRKHDVTVADLKKALDQVRKGTGWVRKEEDKLSLLTVSPEEARAYFHIEQTVPRITPLVVREYSAPRPGTEEGLLGPNDTILWQPVIVLPSDGKAKLQFHLGDAPGGYNVVIGGHTLDGRIGAVRGIIPVTPPQLTTPGTPPVPPAP